MNEILVYVYEDGNKICARIGENLQEGVSGFGDTIPEALRNLADNYKE